MSYPYRIAGPNGVIISSKSGSVDQGAKVIFNHADNSILKDLTNLKATDSLVENDILQWDGENIVSLSYATLTSDARGEPGSNGADGSPGSNGADGAEGVSAVQFPEFTKDGSGNQTFERLTGTQNYLCALHDAPSFDGVTFSTDLIGLNQRIHLDVPTILDGSGASVNIKCLLDSSGYEQVAAELIISGDGYIEVTATIGHTTYYDLGYTYEPSDKLDFCVYRDKCMLYNSNVKIIEIDYKYNTNDTSSEEYPASDESTGTTFVRMPMTSTFEVVVEIVNITEDFSLNNFTVHPLGGQDGRDGADGKDGADGVDGAPGADGRDGIDGAPGADGRDGVDGMDGVPGADGAEGISAVQLPEFTKVGPGDQTFERTVGTQDYVGLLHGESNWTGITFNTNLVGLNQRISLDAPTLPGGGNAFIIECLLDASGYNQLSVKLSMNSNGHLQLTTEIDKTTYDYLDSDHTYSPGDKLDLCIYGDKCMLYRSNNIVTEIAYKYNVNDMTDHYYSASDESAGTTFVRMPDTSTFELIVKSTNLTTNFEFNNFTVHPLGGQDASLTQLGTKIAELSEVTVQKLILGGMTRKNITCNYTTSNQTILTIPVVINAACRIRIEGVFISSTNSACGYYTFDELFFNTAGDSIPESKTFSDVWLPIGAFSTSPISTSTSVSNAVEIYVHAGSGDLGNTGICNLDISWQYCVNE